MLGASTARAGADHIARDLWGRYADFERIYHLSLGEYLKTPLKRPVTAPFAPPSSTEVAAFSQKAITRTSKRVAEGPRSAPVKKDTFWTLLRGCEMSPAVRQPKEFAKRHLYAI